MKDPKGVAGIARSARESFLRRKEVTKDASIYCIQCNAKNPSDSSFCSKCGASLSGGCPKCGKANPTGLAFCTKCGSPLG